MTTKKPYSSLFFNWALSMVLITLSFPKYNLNTQSLILLIIAWLFCNNSSEKAVNLKKNLKAFLIISSFFWLSLIKGLFLGMNKESSERIIDSMPFLILPLVFLSIDFDKEKKQFLLRIFSIAVVVASLFALLKAIAFKTNNLGDFFYYTNFSKILNVHTTYFALFIVIALVYFFYDFLVYKKLKKWQSTACILFLLGILYIVSSRISIMALMFVFVIYFITSIKKTGIKNALGFLILGAVFLIAYLSSPNFQNRSAKTNEFGTEAPSLETRLIHWEAVLNTINKENVFLGDFTGQAKQNLYQEYKKLQFESGYRYKYNAHNQYLETTLSYGVIGLMLLIYMVFLGFKEGFSTNNMQSITILFIFVLFMSTESILERQRGVISFVFFLSMCASQNTKQLND